MTPMVEYNKINLAEAGVAPDVLVDNKDYPVPTMSRTDTPLELTLHTFDTKNTVVRNVEEMETAYAKMESVVRQHRNTLQAKTAAYALITGTGQDCRTDTGQSHCSSGKNIF